MLWSQVPGWCNFKDVYQKAVDRAPGRAHFVELGSAFGKSTALMVSLIKQSEKKITFDAIDIWQRKIKKHWKPGNPFRAAMEEAEGDVYKSFISFMEKTGSTGHVNPIKSSFANAVSRYEDKSLDFIFLDGCHSYEGTMEAINLYLPKLKKGAAYAGHDYTKTWPGVIKAVDELLPSRMIMGSSFWFDVTS